jgi:hypothetical protein
MSHVRSEGRQSGIDILTVTIPFKQAMTGEGMANIVDTRSMPFAFVYTTLLKKFAEGEVHRIGT